MFFLRKTQVNETAGHIFNDGDWERAYTNKARLFLDLQRDHGRCTGKMYRDQKNGSPVQVGWVFEKRECYSDTRGLRPQDFFLCETWVECCPAETLGR